MWPATGTGQGMMRGGEGRRGGDRQGGAGRPDFANMTEAERERFRAMRQQRQAEGGSADGIPSRPTPQEPRAQQPEDPDVAEAKAETDDDDWGGLFGGFFGRSTSRGAADASTTRRD